MRRERERRIPLKISRECHFDRGRHLTLGWRTDNFAPEFLRATGDRDTIRVVGTRKEGFPVIDRINFDTQTGLLVRSYTTMQSVIGSFPEDTFYEDYRDVSGVKVPFTMRVVSAEGNRTYKWSQVDGNAPVDDAKFTKPAPPAPRPPAD